MHEPHPEWRNEQTQVVIAQLLRAGVILSATVVLVGGIIYLIRHATEPPPHAFLGEPENLKSLSGIVLSASSGRGRGIIQLGLLLLIATPIARVVFSVYAFARQRDWTYVLVTLLVLAILLFSLIGERG